MATDDGSAGASPSRREAKQRGLFSGEVIPATPFAGAQGRATHTTSSESCHIIDVGHLRQLDLGVEVPATLASWLSKGKLAYLEHKLPSFTAGV